MCINQNLEIVYSTNLSFGDNLYSHLLILHLPLFAPGPTSMPKMPSPHLLPQFILGREIFRIPKALIQRPLAPFSAAAAGLLRYRFRGRLRRRLPFHERRHDGLRRRRRGQRPPEFPPRGPRRGRRGRDAGRVWALPWAGREGMRRGTRRPIGGGGRRVRSRCGGLAAVVVVGGGEVLLVDGGDALAAAMPHTFAAGNSKYRLRSAGKKEKLN